MDEIRKAKRDRKEAAARLADRSRRKKLYNYAGDQKFAKLFAAAVENIMRAIQDFASKGYSRRKISNIVGMPFSTMQAKYMRWKKERETGETEKAVQKLLDDVRDSGMWSGDETNQQSDEEEKEAAFGTHKLSGSASEQHEHVGVPQELEQPEVLDTESGTPETHTSAAVNSEFQLQRLELLTLKAKVLEAQFMAKKLTAWNKLKGLGVPEDEIEQGLVAFS